MNLKWVKSLPGTTAGKNVFKEAEGKNLMMIKTCGAERFSQAISQSLWKFKVFKIYGEIYSEK